MKNFSVLFAIVLSAIFILSGCSAEMTSIEKDFSSDEISRVEIGSSIDEIIIRAAEGDKLTIYANIKAKEANSFYSVNDKTLKFQVGESIGVHLPSSSSLTLGVPPDMLESLSVIDSIVQQVQIIDVDIPNLDIDVVSGNVIISGIEGIVEAETKIGTVTSELEISSDINKTSTGSFLNSQFGENTENKITINVGQGDIEFK